MPKTHAVRLMRADVENVARFFVTQHVISLDMHHAKTSHLDVNSSKLHQLTCSRTFRCRAAGQIQRVRHSKIRVPKAWQCTICIQLQQQ